MAGVASHTSFPNAMDWRKRGGCSREEESEEGSESQLTLHQSNFTKQHKIKKNHTSDENGESGIRPPPLFAQVTPLERAVREQHGRAASMLPVSLKQVTLAGRAIIVLHRCDGKPSCAVFGPFSIEKKTPCPLLAACPHQPEYGSPRLVSKPRALRDVTIHQVSRR